MKTSSKKQGWEREREADFIGRRRKSDAKTTAPVSCPDLSLQHPGHIDLLPPSLSLCPPDCALPATAALEPAFCPHFYGRRTRQELNPTQHCLLPTPNTSPRATHL
jgi:hypothetical protein